MFNLHTSFIDLYYTQGRIKVFQVKKKKKKGHQWVEFKNSCSTSSYCLFVPVNWGRVGRSEILKTLKQG